MAEQMTNTRPIEPDAAAARERQVRRWRELRRHAAEHVAGRTDVPPFPLRHLSAMARDLAERIGVRDDAEIKLLTIMIHNEAWRETVAGIPFDRRLLLLPQCLRSREGCPAGRDEVGLLCEECGRCAIGMLQREASDLGYAVLIAEGATAAAGLLRQGRLDAVIGVSCLPALEETFTRIAGEALPALAIPLLRDGCNATDVDTDDLLDAIRLSGPSRSAPMGSLDERRAGVRQWFEPAALQSLLDLESGPAAEIALAWLAGDGKRWRPLLAACVYDALRDDGGVGESDPIRTVAVATECFHKASLIHDDIEDDDDFRYGAPTLHTTHGVPVALNVGDLLIGAGYRLLAHAAVSESVRLRMLAAAATAHCGLCGGQGEELHWRRATDFPATADLIRIYSRKTAPAFDVAMQLGALAADADADTCAVLTAFSRALGIAYQIDDDLQDADQDAGGGRDRGAPLSIRLALLAERCTASERQAVRTAWRDAPAAAGHTRDFVAALDTRYGATVAAEQLRDEYRDQALDCLSPIRSVRLKSVLTRLVKRILPEYGPTQNDA